MKPVFQVSMRAGRSSLIGLSGLLCAAGFSGAAEGLRNPAVDWESLPVIRTGVRVWSHTSVNPLNFTIMDWTNYTLQDADGYELAHHEGSSGMLVQSWFGSQTKVGNLRLFLSGQPKPDYDLPFEEYFNGKGLPFSLWHFEDRMLWAFPCLPFDLTFRASFQKRPEWYQWTLDLYREKRFSEALTRDESAVLERKIAAPVGTFPGKEPGNQAVSSTLELAPGATATAFDVTRAGVVRSIKLRPPSEASAVLDNLAVRITTDGVVTAELPVSMFCGGYPGTNIRHARGMAAGYDGEDLYCYFPMPFWASMKIEFINQQAQAAKVVCVVGWSDANPYPQASTGVFKVQYNPPTQVRAGAPAATLLNVEGAGTLVGCVTKLVGGIESNFTTYADDSETPVIETTGGEDYFNHSFGMHAGFCSAFSGGLAGNDTGYRFQIVDYVPFLVSLKFTQDHAIYFAHDRDGQFLSAVFYYHNPRKLLSLTDTLDVGKAKSEAAHGYVNTGSRDRARSQTDEGRYENDEEKPLTDDGRWTDQETSFRVTVSPDNDGVRLRKRINQTAYHQRVEVYVDGKFAGIWFEQGSNYVNHYDHADYKGRLTKKYAEAGLEIPTWQNGKMSAVFRDTTFDLPADLTRGKDHLDLRFVTKDSLAVSAPDAGLTNEYYYWVYSYAKTP